MLLMLNEIESASSDGRLNKNLELKVRISELIVFTETKENMRSVMQVFKTVM